MKNTPTTATHVLLRYGITVDQAAEMGDAELLALTGFGRSALAYLRGYIDGRTGKPLIGSSGQTLIGRKKSLGLK